MAGIPVTGQKRLRGFFGSFVFAFVYALRNCSSDNNNSNGNQS